MLFNHTFFLLLPNFQADPRAWTCSKVPDRLHSIFFGRIRFSLLPDGYNEDSMTTGQRLRDIRIKRDKTLEDVANAIGVSATAISKYESDRIKNIPQNKLKGIAEFLDVSISYILGLDDPQEASPIVLSIDEQMLIEDYRKLSVLNQETVQILVRRLVTVEHGENEIVQLHL